MTDPDTAAAMFTAAATYLPSREPRPDGPSAGFTAFERALARASHEAGRTTTEALLRAAAHRAGARPPRTDGPTGDRNANRAVDRTGDRNTDRTGDRAVDPVANPAVDPVADPTADFAVAWDEIARWILAPE